MNRRYPKCPVVLAALAAFVLGVGALAPGLHASAQGSKVASATPWGGEDEAVQPATRLVDLLITQQADGTRVVLIGDGEVINYNAFTLQDPPRIVVDLWHMTHTFRSRKIPVRSQELKRVRIGTYPQKIRVVLDLDERTAGFPPYSLQREGYKLILGLGDLAKGLEGETQLPLLKPGESPDVLLTAQIRDAAMESSKPAVSQAEPSADHGHHTTPQSPSLGEEKEESKSSAPSQDQTEVAGPPEPDIWALVEIPFSSAPLESQEPPSGEEPVALQEPEAVEKPQGLSSLRETETGDEIQTSPLLIAESLPQRTPSPPPEAELPAEEKPAPSSSTPALESTGNESMASASAALSSPSQGETPPIREEIVMQTVEGEVTPARGSFTKEAGLEAVILRNPLPPTSPLNLREEVQPAAQVSPTPEELLKEEPFHISTGMEPGKVYVGQRISLDFQDIDIDNVFRLLAEVSDLNIIVSDKVKGKVTMRLKDVPWDQALDLIIATHKLGMVKQGNVIRIAPLADLIKEEKERRRLRQEKIKERLEAQKRIQEAEIERRERERKLRPFETVPIVLNYTKAKDLEKQIKGFLTREPDINKVGSVIVDERTNTITITDYPEKIEFIKHYIKQVDTPTPQVLIEARIVKASKNFAREIGIQWGGQFAEFDRTGEWAYGVSSGYGPGNVPLASPSTWRSSAFTGNTGFDFNPLSSWMVNLPATLLGAGTPGIGFQVGRLVGDLINLDLRLSAAEAEGLTKIVSRPKIMTLDNVEATIKQGFEIPYTQVNPEGNVSVVWKKAELKTTVTPLISPDGRVHLKLEVTDDFPDPTILSSEGEPAIRTRQAYTEVLVKNGETVVIGGILEETEAYTEEGVPGLRDIPILNWLFERKNRRRDQTELLIFVTPFIVEET